VRRPQWLGALRDSCALVAIRGMGGLLHLAMQYSHDLGFKTVAAANVLFRAVLKIS
jgi:D-arabinose 1-dehydrogenase-like Zn-dependent alcohol dehydrogenase